MRWNKKPIPKEPQEGEFRYVRRFLFFPKTLMCGWSPGPTMMKEGQPIDQTRWLEMSRIRQQYKKVKQFNMNDMGFEYWDELQWVDHSWA